MLLVSRVSKRFYALSSNEKVWRELYEREMKYYGGIKVNSFRIAFLHRKRPPIVRDYGYSKVVIGVGISVVVYCADIASDMVVMVRLCN